MKLEFEIYTALCEPKIFKINGIDANYNDFGDKYDAAASDAEEYCCGDMRFHPKLPTTQILKKYKITLDDYNEIIGKLNGLSFGSCGWCS